MRYTLVSILLLFCISVNAQQLSRLSGVVKTTENETLVYANIRLVNTSVSAVRINFYPFSLFPLRHIVEDVLDVFVLFKFFQ